MLYFGKKLVYDNDVLSIIMNLLNWKTDFQFANNEFNNVFSRTLCGVRKRIEEIRKW